MIGFLATPTERTYERFMRQCSFDLDGLREQMGERWGRSSRTTSSWPVCRA